MTEKSVCQASGGTLSLEDWEGNEVGADIKQDALWLLKHPQAARAAPRAPGRREGRKGWGRGGWRPGQAGEREGGGGGDGGRQDSARRPPCAA